MPRRSFIAASSCGLPKGRESNREKTASAWLNRPARVKTNPVTMAALRASDMIRFERGPQNLIAPT